MKIAGFPEIIKKANSTVTIYGHRYVGYPSGGAGNLVLTCSNSFDGQRWYADTAHSITVPLTGVTSTNFSTNLTSLGSFQYFQYTVLNSSGNAIPYFDLKASKKNGL